MTDERVFSSSPYFGITHKVPRVLFSWWRRRVCPKGWHVFDEIRRFGEEDHYLSCEACRLMVHIEAIEVTYVT